MTNNKSVGRPKMQYGRQVLILDCTHEEFRIIREALSTRERVVALLEWIGYAYEAENGEVTE